MVKRHKPLWDWLPSFIEINGIKSIMDVGGGMAYAKQFVEKYILFDFNKPLLDYLVSKDSTLQAVCIDYTKADLTDNQGYDLVLMCAIAEHFHNLRELISKALEGRPN